MGNDLISCKEDVNRVEILLNKYFEPERTPEPYESERTKRTPEPKQIHIKKVFDCYPETELFLFLKNNLIKVDDTLIIYFAGHGKLIGKKIENKVHMISTWVNPNKSYVYSYNIDKILSKINCNNIILISDSCHSGGFGDFYNGSSPFIFIGSSSLIQVSNEYSIGEKPAAGILTYVLEEGLEYILSLNNELGECEKNEKIEKNSERELGDEFNLIVKKIYKNFKVRKLPVIKIRKSH